MTVEEFLDSYSPEVREMALKARETVQRVAPKATERVHTGWKIIVYGLGDKMAEQFCAIMPLRSYVNLGFYKGTDLPDPKGLLEGTGKRLRHVKIKQIENADGPALRALIKAAYALGKQ